MSTDQLLIELKQNDNLLPQELLKDITLSDLTKSLIEIFDDHRDELEADLKLRANFTELINYIYLVTLSKKPEQRNKHIFSNQLTTFLLNPA
jgi:RecG-like helicase